MKKNRLKSNKADVCHNRGCAKSESGDIKGAIKDLLKAGKLGDKDAYDKIREIQNKLQADVKSYEIV